MTDAPSPRCSSGLTELRPCPFCGGEPQFVCGGPGNWYVRCIICKAASDDLMRHVAIERWNARALSPKAQTGETDESDEFRFAHEGYCNASRKLPVGCDGCSCRAGREIKRLRAELAGMRGVAQAPALDRYRVAKLVYATWLDADFITENHFAWFDAGKDNPESCVHYSNVAKAFKVADRVLGLTPSVPSTDRGISIPDGFSLVDDLPKCPRCGGMGRVGIMACNDCAATGRAVTSTPRGGEA